MRGRDDRGASDRDAARLSLVSVLSPGTARIVGSGVYVGERRLLTCAHVVNEALGRAMFARPAPENASLPVRFPCAPERPALAARLVAWKPAHRAGAPDIPVILGEPLWGGDLAVLELMEEPSAPAAPAPWRYMDRGQEVRAWYGDGASFTYADSSVGSVQHDHGFVDGAPRGAAIGPGYSGGPLWCDKEQASVGLVLGVMSPPDGPFRGENVLRRAIVAPWQTVERFLAALEIRVGPARSDTGSLPPGSVAPVLRHKLHTVILNLLPDEEQRLRHTHRVLSALGLPGGSAADSSVAALVDLVLTRPRAAAVLTDELPRALRETALKLLSLCRGALVPGILTPLELASLLALLDGEPGRLLEEAARDALVNTTFWDEPLETLRGEPDDAVRHLVLALENYWGDSGSTDTPHRVPALLTAVEYVAALTAPGQRSELREWVAAVAERTGVHESVLLSRRTDAEDWARARRARTTPAEPRLTVRLDRDPSGGHRCIIWYDPGTGQDGALRQVLADDEPRGPQDVARLVQDVLLREVPATVRVRSSPLVEFLVEPEDLDLPVDRWDDGDSESGFPSVLGVEYAVVVRCPELRTQSLKRLRAWETRSVGFPSGGFARLMPEHSEPEHVYKLLHQDQQTGRLAIGCAPEHRPRLQVVCLAHGIPVVLWDRNDSPRRIDQLTALMLNGHPRSLPERVRAHRARTLGNSGEEAVAPVLVWDDASRTPPDPYWSDPSWEDATS
ncbi:MULTISPECIES: trypsin-like peptidase domain-containing protein [Streptomyces]|uniref:Trypsin-like peptidase domain-containing protein n=1 Tax=Streptomyces glycanivorans TaxID=3033808 RepID=A0ABY9JHC5_9ACTN|nr:MULTISPECIES: trypsin-like peptidase domain-containing protein [unclassified Streptomyces]WSQ79631.1 serine protease [Streptomyces sp. NBC_01213]TXS15471.1 serine protease [Streptomyces sp. wa22]WLQ66189.1 trypsin-like peptidase domain-containing protein [Streptomyces sp. Alt3]WSQ87011.1 serine protease [Streptomyces sp. NBC_01212]WSR06970.1 serine protease [Streptomyces sp. NBC_01208]